LNFDPLLVYLEKSPTYPIDRYVVFNKVENEKLESDVKTGNANSFSRHFDEKPEKLLKIEFDPLCRENLPRYDINMYVIFDTVHYEEFDSEEKTGNGSSFVRHFEEKLSKTAENCRK